MVSPRRRTWSSLTFVPTCCNMYRIETSFLVPALLPRAILLSLIPHGQVKVWHGRSQRSHLAVTVTMSEGILPEVAAWGWVFVQA